jgi:hypothetical protein
MAISSLSLTTYHTLIQSNDLLGFINYMLEPARY